MRYVLPAIVVCTAVWALVAAEARGQPVPSAIVTVLDGPARLIRGVSAYTPAQGARVRPGDIVETDDGALMQIEWPDGVEVSIAGPGRGMITAFGAAGSRSPVEVFLLSGFFKAAVPAGAQLRVSSPHLVATAAAATMVMTESAAGAALFDETGQLGVESAGATTRLHAGDFYSRRGEQRATVADRPDRGFVASLPRPFLDALPTRWNTFRDRDVPLRGQRDFTYAQVEAWLDSTPAIRRILVSRWQSKANDPAFRKALLANLRNHPEWDAILFPDKLQTGR